MQLDEYVKASRTAEAREDVKKFEPKTELPKGDWRRTLKYRVPDTREREYDCMRINQIMALLLSDIKMISSSAKYLALTRLSA